MVAGGGGAVAWGSPEKKLGTGGCNDQISKDLSLCAYRASPWIELASTHSIDEYQNSKCIIYYNI